MHDEDPMRFHLETGFGEDEFRALHSMPATRCLRHRGHMPFHRRGPGVPRSLSLDDSGDSEIRSVDGNEGEEESDQEGLSGSNSAPEPFPNRTSHAAETETETRPPATPEPFSTPLSRQRDLVPPSPQLAWILDSTRSLNGLHRSFPSSEDLWTAGAGQPSHVSGGTIWTAGVSVCPSRLTHGARQKPGIGRVRAQRSQRNSEYRQLLRMERAAEIAGAVTGEGGDGADSRLGHNGDMLVTSGESSGSQPQKDGATRNEAWQAAQRLRAASQRGRQFIPQISVTPPEDRPLTPNASDDTDSSTDSEASSLHSNPDESEFIHVQINDGGVDDLGRARQETQAQLHLLARRAARLESRRRVLEAAREGLEGRLRRLELETER